MRLGLIAEQRVLERRRTSPVCRRGGAVDSSGTAVEGPTPFHVRTVSVTRPVRRRMRVLAANEVWLDVTSDLVPVAALALRARPHLVKFRAGISICRDVKRG